MFFSKSRACPQYNLTAIYVEHTVFLQHHRTPVLCPKTCNLHGQPANPISSQAQTERVQLTSTTRKNPLTLSPSRLLNMRSALLIEGPISCFLYPHGSSSNSCGSSPRFVGIATATATTRPGYSYHSCVGWYSLTLILISIVSSRAEMTSYSGCRQGGSVGLVSRRSP